MQRRHPRNPLAARLRIAALSLALAAAGAVHAGELKVFTSDAAGFNTHSVWYDDGHEVTVVDTQFTPAIAEALIADIRRQTRSPITRVIVTHPNPDKFNALGVFHREGIESIASARTAAAMPGVDTYKRYFWTQVAKAFTDATYPKSEPVKTTFHGEKVIRLKSGETLTLLSLPQPGVAADQTVVRIDRSGDLIAGDLVAHKVHAWLEGGIVDGKPVPTINGWKAGLQQLPKLGKGTLYGGRGAFGPVSEVVPAQIAYLDRADSIVTRYVQNLGDKAAELRDANRAQSHFAAIQAELAKAFPDYAMPELVGYSVYGLALSKLPKQPVAN